MRRALTVFLPPDSLEHIERVRKKIEDRAGGKVTDSDAVEWIVRSHWKRMMAKNVSGPKRKKALSIVRG